MRPYGNNVKAMDKDIKGERRNTATYPSLQCEGSNSLAL